jgi:hypothetical protein
MFIDAIGEFYNSRGRNTKVFRVNTEIALCSSFMIDLLLYWLLKTDHFGPECEEPLMAYLVATGT